MQHFGCIRNEQKKCYFKTSKHKLSSGKYKKKQTIIIEKFLVNNGLDIGQGIKPRNEKLE